MELFDGLVFVREIIAIIKRFNSRRENLVKHFKLFTQPLVLPVPVLAVFEIGFIQREAYVALLLLVLSTPLQFGTNLFLYIYLVSFQEVEVSQKFD